MMYQRTKGSARNLVVVQWAILVLVGLGVVGLSGCAGLGRTIGHTLSGEEQNREKLSESVTRFHQALYWGDSDQAALFVVPEIRPDFLYQASLRKDEEKVVTTEVKRIVLEESRDEATVDVFIKYYKIPRYEVNTRHEKQTWEFHPTEARWLFRESELVKLNKPDNTL